MSYAASATAIGISQDTWYNWMNHGNAGKSPYAAFYGAIRETEAQLMHDCLTTLRKQIDLMSDQLTRKDDQISQLNEVTQKQAVHIQSLIQKNSKLNMKLLPEVTENNKPGWKFW